LSAGLVDAYRVDDVCALSGKLAAMKVGDDWRVLREQVEQWVASGGSLNDK